MAIGGYSCSNDMPTYLKIKQASLQTMSKLSPSCHSFSNALPVDILVIQSYVTLRLSPCFVLETTWSSLSLAYVTCEFCPRGSLACWKALWGLCKTTAWIKGRIWGLITNGGPKTSVTKMYEMAFYFRRSWESHLTGYTLIFDPFWIRYWDHNINCTFQLSRVISRNWNHMMLTK